MQYPQETAEQIQEAQQQEYDNKYSKFPITAHVHRWINILRAEGRAGWLHGCITGSCLLDAIFDLWETPPDIDVFTYDLTGITEMVSVLTRTYGCRFGADDTPLSAKQEEWKYNKARVSGWKKSDREYGSLNTVKLRTPDGLIINISNKRNQKSVADVVNAFDMTIVMKGIDLERDFIYDMTKAFGGSQYKAMPNLLRNADTSLFTVQHWIRQFIRVTKYWDRGYDTREMARFYLDQIDKCTSEGPLFPASEASMQIWNECLEEFTDMRGRIEKWLEYANKEVNEIE